MAEPIIINDRSFPPPDFYEIRGKAHVALRWTEWFDNMTMVHTEAGETIFSGYIVDQAALHGLLTKIRDLNLTLVSVSRRE